MDWDILRAIVLKIEEQKNNRTVFPEYAPVVRKGAIGPVNVDQKQRIRDTHYIENQEEVGGVSLKPPQTSLSRVWAPKLLPSQGNPFLNLTEQGLNLGSTTYTKF